MTTEKLPQLNKGQASAVNHRQGPLLVIAGAGTGKTTVLIRRMIDLLRKDNLASDQVLLLTFTEKSAAEMEERADKLLPYGYLDLWINTFHSFAEKILREHSLEIGIPSDFKILNSVDQWLLVRKNLERFDLNYYRPLGNPHKFITELLKHFSKLKDENISAKEYLDYVKGIKNEDETEVQRLQELSKAYQVYNEILLESNFLDFGDLIVYTLKLFNSRPKLLNFYQKKFNYIMVDEFQDTNWAQYELVKLLSLPDNNLMVVGDDDQAIYRFRGASIANIMQFKDDFPEAKEIVLNENYRSRQDILDCAYKFISHNNPNRLESKLGINKVLKAKGPNADLGKAPLFVQLARQEDELDYVSSQIIEIYHREKSKDISWSDFAILARSNNTAESFSKELSRKGIPNQFVSLRGLYYKPIILDCLAYLRLLNNYHDSTSLFRVLNINSFRINHSDIIALNRLARRKAWSLFETLKKAELVNDLSPEALPKIKKLVDLVAKHSELVADNLPSKIFFKFVEESGLITGLDINKDQELFSYLNQFYQKIKKFEAEHLDMRLSDFMQLIDLELEAGDTGSLKMDYFDADTVKVMTVHAAKGLEFPYVFLVNISDKKFPTINRSDKIPISENLVKESLLDSKDAHVEEERRLFYVALTRAKQELHISSAKDYGGAKEKKASRFIDESGLKIENVDMSLEKNELIRDLKNNDEIFLTTEKIAEKLPDKFSFSQLAAYETCPLQYKFAFILKIPAPEDKPSLIFGRVMHNVFYDFLKPLELGLQGALFQDPLSQEDLLNKKRLKKILNERWVNDGYESSKQRQEYKDKAEKALDLFIGTFVNNGHLESKPIFLEKSFAFKIGGETIKGTIDRVDSFNDGVEVIDYKTGTSKDKLEWKNKRQLILYQLFLEEVLQMKVLSLKYYYVESGAILSFSPSEKEKDKLRQEVIKQIKAIRSRNFQAKPSVMCSFCDFNNICEFRQN